MKNILFIWIPKCAGTTIDKHYKLNHQVANNKRFKYNFKNKGNVTFGHADIRILLQRKVLSQNFYTTSFKFCIVRNPYDRAVSLFHYLPGLAEKYSFDDWVKYLYENRQNIPKNNNLNLVNWKNINNQWNLMSSWITDDIDKIYYYENGLSSIINDINENIGKDEILPNVNVVNKSMHKPYFYYYKNKCTRNYIYEIYEKDFVMFNYCKEIIDKRN